MKVATWVSIPERFYTKEKGSENCEADEKLGFEWHLFLWVLAIFSLVEVANSRDRTGRCCCTGKKMWVLKVDLILDLSVCSVVAAIQAWRGCQPKPDGWMDGCTESWCPPLPDLMAPHRPSWKKRGEKTGDTATWSCTEECVRHSKHWKARDNTSPPPIRPINQSRTRGWRNWSFFEIPDSHSHEWMCESNESIIILTAIVFGYSFTDLKICLGVGDYLPS